MRVVAIQFDIAWEDKPANHTRIEHMLDEAVVEPGSYVVLPELGDTGFSFNLDAIVDDASLTWATGLARRRGIWLQPGYAERATDGKGRNCAAIVGPDGEVRGVYRKVHPFSYGREAEYYAGGDTLLIHECDGAAFCPLICYDLRFPELWRIAALAGAEIFTIGASWPQARQAHWRALLIARAVENLAYVVGVNRAGSDPSYSYAGGSMIVSPRGEILAEADHQTAALSAVIDLSAPQAWRAEFPALRDARKHLLGSLPLHTTMKRNEGNPASTE